MKFKVGDWVLYKKSIFKIDIIDIENYDEPMYIIDKNELYAKELKLWKPKEGEYCWYLRIPELVKISEVFDSEFNCYNYDGKRYTEYSINMFEPFIGTLPSFIKDK